jgi:4-hydroxythreonine-4-phosphate dehydrogenase
MNSIPHAKKPLLLFTMGDVAGVGPEIIARAWPRLRTICTPVVVGDPPWMKRAIELAGHSGNLIAVDELPREDDVQGTDIICLRGSKEDLSGVRPAAVHAAAGRGAYDFLCTAIDLAMSGKASGIVTAPLHKEGLRAANLPYPGHTEILAERTGTSDFAMVLAVEGLAVAHVTLHMALRDVFGNLTTQGILEKIQLLDRLLRRLGKASPRIAVLALNPHASDGGLFGDEEARIIAPAVAEASESGVLASGPWPADTLFVRARGGEFDGVVAMYHDQGHIALKLLGWQKAVNISAGLPIVRTSVAHGTAYDIAWQGRADATSLIEAAGVAVTLSDNPD